MSETVTYEEWKRHRACTRKHPFDNIVEANWQVLLHWKAGQWAETYDCKYCGKIHITTNDDRQNPDST